MNQRNNPYPYSGTDIDPESPWNFEPADVVPADVRQAEQARREAYSRHDQALSTIARLDAELQAAKIKDQRDLAAALADGKPAPSPANIAKLEAQLADAKRMVEASRSARHIVGQRFRAVAVAADLQPAVKQYDAECVAKLAQCRDLMAQARAARDEAVTARHISRTLDAFPAGPNSIDGRVITDAGAWTLGVRNIEGDLTTLDDSTPESLRDGLSERERNQAG